MGLLFKILEFLRELWTKFALAKVDAARREERVETEALRLEIEGNIYDLKAQLSALSIIENFPDQERVQHLKERRLEIEKEVEAEWARLQRLASGG